MINRARVEELAAKFTELQNSACDMLAKVDGKAMFSKVPWKKEIGTGITRVLSGGEKIEKAAINFSFVEGVYSKQMAKAAGKEPGKFVAAGVSSIIHPVNPIAPITHMNVRYFELENGDSWFGGGIDLTPHYVDIEQAVRFHQRLKETCDYYNKGLYPKFKSWADDYFFLSHRNETRGIGGIFYDHQKPGEELMFEEWANFSCDQLKLYPEIYSELLLEKCDLKFTKEHKRWQALRRGRYVEFNLLHDRGTKFGIASGGNTESILVSMPPNAEWEYNYEAKVGSEEEKTLNLLRKNIDWINYRNE